MITDINNNNNQSASATIADKEVIETKDMEQEVQQSLQLSDSAPKTVDTSNENTTKEINPYIHPSLTDYLERQYPIRSLTWTSASPQGALLATIFLPEALLNNRALFEKVSRFSFLQCKFHVSIRVNGTSFHYGKLLVSYDVSPRPTGTIDYKTRNNLYSQSSFPHVIVSPGQNEVKEFEIPFIYPLDYWPIDTVSPSALYGRRYPMASVSIWVLNPLSSSTVVPDVSLTVLANMKDVKIAGYSNGIPQTFLSSLSDSYLNDFNANIPSTFSLGSKPKPDDEFEAQIYIEPRKLALPDYNNACKDINTLSLGDWSSPSFHTDENNVVTDLHKFIGRQALLTSGPMTSSDASGTDLISWDVNPRVVAIASETGGTRFYNTPLAFVADRFAIWRGTMNYTIQMVCSSFHSGRIQILYYPLGTTYETSEPYELLSRIVDVQKDLEIKFSIPYTFIRPYTNDSIGTLVIKVVNPLTFKEAPVPDIYFNIWVSGGSDFEFLFPRLVPYTHNETAPPAPPADEFEAQISTGPEEKTYEPLAPFQSMSSSMRFHPIDGNQICNKATTLILVPPTTTNNRYSWTKMYPEGSFPTQGRSGPYHPLFSAMALMTRFRRGSMIYIINSRSRGTRATLDETEDDFVLVNLNAITREQPFFTTSYSNGVRDDAAVEDGTIIRSSNLSLQPLSIKVPYGLCLNYAENSISDGGSGNNYSMVASRSEVNVYASGQIEISAAADSDMKFIFQYSPPTDFVPGP